MPISRLRDTVVGQASFRIPAVHGASRSLVVHCSQHPIEWSKISSLLAFAPPTRSFPYSRSGVDGGGICLDHQPYLEGFWFYPENQHQKQEKPAITKLVESGLTLQRADQMGCRMYNREEEDDIHHTHRQAVAAGHSGPC